MHRSFAARRMTAQDFVLKFFFFGPSRFSSIFACTCFSFVHHDFPTLNGFDMFLFLVCCSDFPQDTHDNHLLMRFVLKKLLFSVAYFL